MFKRLFALSLTFGMAAAAPPVFAATCGAREDLVTQLREKFSEELTVGGLQQAGDETTIFEVWSSGKTGTYTVLISNPNGVSCVVAAGTDFFKARPKAAPEGTGS